MQVRELMTSDLATVDQEASARDAAQLMANRHIGTVLVTDGGALRGILTDRDLALRVIGEGRDPSRVRCGDICTTSLRQLKPQDDVDEAVRMMREQKLRRVPIVEGNRPVGIVSLGDLAKARDPKSVLGRISSAPPND